jgi:hypothetical protein
MNIFLQKFYHNILFHVIVTHATMLCQSILAHKKGTPYNQNGHLLDVQLHQDILIETSLLDQNKIGV